MRVSIERHSGSTMGSVRVSGGWEHRNDPGHLLSPLEER